MIFSFLAAGSLGTFDGLDFFQEEGSHDAGLDASGAEDSTVGSRYGLLSLGKLLVSIGPELGDSVDSLSAVATIMWGTRSMRPLLNVLNHNLGSRGPDLSNFVRAGVVAESSSVGNSLGH